MPVLDRANWEVYAQNRAAGKNKSVSARNAGYSDSCAHVQASRLEKKPEVIARIRELSDRANNIAVANVQISREWVLSELVSLEAIAKQKQQVSSATRCVELVGKELGMFQDVIPREMFNLMMALMGATVTRYVSDPAILERIIEEWEKISVAQPRELKAGMVVVSKGDELVPDIPSE